MTDRAQKQKAGQTQYESITLLPTGGFVGIHVLFHEPDRLLGWPS